MLEKVIIAAFSDPEMRAEVGSWTAQLNPETYKQQFDAALTATRGIDSAGSVTKGTHGGNLNEIGT